MSRISTRLPSRTEKQERVDFRDMMDGSTDFTDPIHFMANVSMNLPRDYVLANPDWEFSMVPYQNKSEDWSHKVVSAIKTQKYVFVKQSEHPSLEQNVILGSFGDKDQDDYYRINGHIALKRPKKVADAERAYFARMAQEQEMGARLARDPNSDAPMYTSHDTRMNRL